MADFFSSLLAPFTGDAQQNAANAQIQGLNNAYQQYAGLNQQAMQNLQNYYGAAQGNINQYFPQAQNQLQGNYALGLAPVQQNQAAAGLGTNQLLTMLGLGPGGQQGAQAALAATPGYQFALDQGSQNVLRNQAATGALNSGATNVDLTNYAQGLANQTYQNAVNNLQPFLGYGTNAAGQGLSGYGQLGSGLAGLSSGQGQQLAGLNTGLGQGIAGLLGNQGSAAYGTQAGIGNANANAALAPLQAGNNMWNLLGNIGKLGTNTLGGQAITGVGNLFGSFGQPTGGVNANWAQFGQ